MRVCLTIAGSDSVAGAGIQADLKTFSELKVYGTSVITSVTAQNTLGVQSIHDLPPDFIRIQLQSILSDVRVDSVKMGMLSQKATVETVAETLHERGIENLVVDPIMVSKGGTVLLAEEARRSLRERLLPIAKIATPNIYEAGWLSGVNITGVDDMKSAARVIHESGVEWILVKGGHLKERVADILYDGKKMEVLDGDGSRWEEVHGTGCILSAAIAANLAKGLGVREAVSQARSYLREAVSGAVRIGQGWKVAPQQELV
jgi:hydroxymethylpyrimidine/phosphomethylpyrimidine kinase